MGHDWIDGCFFFVLLLVAITDQKTMEIPDRYHLIIVAIAIADCVLRYVSAQEGPSILARIIGAVCVSVPMLLLCLLIEGAFGGGDIKLMAASGLYLGWKLTLLSTFFGIVLGGIWGAILLLAKKKEKKEHFAFGPFLCAGMTISVLWGNQILDAYLGLLAF